DIFCDARGAEAGRALARAVARGGLRGGRDRPAGRGGNREERLVGAPSTRESARACDLRVLVRQAQRASLADRAPHLTPRVIVEGAPRRDFVERAQAADTKTALRIHAADADARRWDRRRGL